MKTWGVLILAAAIAAAPVVTMADDVVPERVPLEKAYPPPPEDEWFGTLSMRVGYLYESETESFVTCGMVPVLGWKDSNLEMGFGVDGQVFGALTYDVGCLEDLGVDNFLGEVVSLHVGIYVGTKLGIADVDEEQDDLIWGVALTIFNFNTDEKGNEREQATRNRR